MGKGMKPDKSIACIYDIDPAEMRALGVKGFLFDIDNTLEVYAAPLPSARLQQWLSELKREGFRLGIISNAKIVRAKHFADGFDFPVEFVGKAGKPLKKGFTQLAASLKLRPAEIAMVGDQLYTDILGGNRFGCYTILVSPIDLSREPAFVRFKRLLEKPFL